MTSRDLRRDLATYNAGVIAAINACRTSEHGERQCARSRRKATQ